MAFCGYEGRDWFVDLNIRTEESIETSFEEADKKVTSAKGQVNESVQLKVVSVDRSVKEKKSVIQRQLHVRETTLL